MNMERVLVVWLVWATMVVAKLQGLSGCLEKERLGLVELWKSVKPINLTHLPSDCCSWDGVNCSAITGRVQALYFSSFQRPSTIFGRDYPYSFLNISLFLPFEELLKLDFYKCGFDGLINQQDLIKLTRLETLTMRFNNFKNNGSLQVFANMKNLKYLDLSYNNMTIDLKGICEMNNILELDLSYNAIRGHLPHCIGNLTQLQLFNISYNQMSGNIPSTIGHLSNLSSLSLEENNWSDSFYLHSLANNSKLENLSLSSHQNHFQVETETQSWFPSFQLKNLLLRNSNINTMSNSIIPSFLLYQSELRAIDLSHNKLQGIFPSWLLQNNSKLERLSMSNNSLTGNLILPNSTHGLLYIDVSDNKIGGKLPNNLQVFLPLLQILQLSKNRFEGNLPSSFGALIYVDLSFNSFSGTLPKTLLANNFFLRAVDLSHNLLHGEISLNLTALPSLVALILRNNNFSGIFEELSSQSSSQFRAIDISNNLISSKLSNFIANFSSLQFLAVSNNSFEGRIPNKLCHMSTLNYLDISLNNLSGSIHSCLRALSLKFLYMRNCSLSGAIPNELSTNSMLIDIDLSYNNFSLEILPNWIYSQPKLQILQLAGIQLEGEISTRLCELENIQIMDLLHNSFNGTIPSCLFTRPFWVAESQVDYSYSKNHFIARTMIGLSHEHFEFQFTTKGASMRFEGSILNFMNGLDISSNKLSGKIPPQIGDSEAIHTMNLSNNRLWGSIPSSIFRLKEIESLDLSSNNLSGEIPPEIINLNFLSIFNVSNNNLSGPIPTGGQFSNFDERNYRGNELLCGPFIHRLCTTSSSPRTRDEQEDDETIFERMSFWWSFATAYVIVFISVIIVVGIDTRFSRVWFGAVDAFFSKVLSVFVKLKCVLCFK